MTVTALQKICRDMAQRFGNEALLLHLPATSYVGQATLKIQSAGLVQFDETDKPALNEIANSILSAMKSGLDLTKRQLRKAAWCLWETRPALADYPGILKKILQLLISGKKRLFKALATVYLSQFRMDRPGLSEISRALQHGAIKFGSPWKELQENYALYDKDNGPKRLAALALQQKSSVPDVMRNLQLSALSTNSGFSNAVTRSILKSLSLNDSDDHLQRLKLVRRYALNNDGKMLFPGLDEDVASALMLPFLQSRTTPDDSIKDPFLDTLLNLFADPRLNPGRWEKMGKIKAEVIAWLTQQSLRQFLDIVDHITTTPSEKSMWRYRRAFWEAVYRNNLIKGAWVIFADDGAAATRKFYGKEVKFGRFRKGGSRPAKSSHAVLLLKIGNGVVADWSHNGKVNIWTSSEDSDAPKLYRSSYDADDVRHYVGQGNINTARNLVQTHSSPQTYSWQKVVAERIWKMTNTRIHEHEYKVRR